MLSLTLFKTVTTLQKMNLQTKWVSILHSVSRDLQMKTRYNLMKNHFMVNSQPLIIPGAKMRTAITIRIKYQYPLIVAQRMNLVLATRQGIIFTLLKKVRKKISIDFTGSFGASMKEYRLTETITQTEASHWCLSGKDVTLAKGQLARTRQRSIPGSNANS